jgi:hypothetical protein
MKTAEDYRHDRLLDALYKRLKETRLYNGVWKRVPYHRDGLEGEIDVLAVRTTPRGEYVHAYEVKSTDNLKSYLKAQEQLYRFKSAFRESNIKLVYVTPTKVERL